MTGAVVCVGPIIGRSQDLFFVFRLFLGPYVRVFRRIYIKEWTRL